MKDFKLLSRIGLALLLINSIETKSKVTKDYTYYTDVVFTSILKGKPLFNMTYHGKYRYKETTTYNNTGDPILVT